MLSHVEVEARAVIGGELGAHLLKREVVLAAGLEQEFIEKEGLMELHVPCEGAQGVRELLQELVGCEVVKALVYIEDVVVIAIDKIIACVHISNREVKSQLNIVIVSP